MEGNELLKLLDFVKQLREEEHKLRKASEDADDSKEKVKCRASAEGYDKIAKDLDNLLRELNS